MKLSNLLPFQCFLVNGAESVLINFGTVICPVVGSENNYFVPTINTVPLVRFREEGFSTKNLLALSSENAIICLKVYLENIEDMVTENSTLWEEVAVDGSQSSFQDMINRSMSLELQRDFFNDFIDDTESVEDIDFNGFFLNYAMSSSLNPIISRSPKVVSVKIVAENFTNLQEEELGSKYSLIQNDGEYYKLCPIAIVQEAVLSQIIDFDYIFSHPFYWLETLKQPFHYVQE